MVTFIKPAQMDGEQLITELTTAGVEVTGYPFVDNDGNLHFDISLSDQEKAKAIIKAHIPIPKPEPTILEKLETIGVSIPELKTALGL